MRISRVFLELIKGGMIKKDQLETHYELSSGFIMVFDIVQGQSDLN